MFTGIYYGSYKQGREMIWISGMLLFMTFSVLLDSLDICYHGDKCLTGQMVITNLFGGVPVIGDALVVWIRGDFNVADATLTRFFMLHVFLLPIVIMGLIGITLFIH